MAIWHTGILEKTIDENIKLRKKVDELREKILRLEGELQKNKNFLEHEIRGYYPK